jgi:tRNA pseudouridine65 synthase
MTFQILYQDEHYVAINKPCRILVHRSAISEDKVFVLQLLRDQLGQKIYPIHRLDRATSGVLIFGRTSEAASLLGKQMQEQLVKKTYLAIIRGYVDAQGTIDYPLAPEPDRPKQEAITHYKKLNQSEMPFSVGKYPNSRYSLVEVTLETGRRHQIRRHFSHLRHPIINDRRHGDVKHNKYFENTIGTERLLLHAHKMKLYHPVQKEIIEIVAPLDEDFEKMIEYLFGILPET